MTYMDLGYIDSPVLMDAQSIYRPTHTHAHTFTPTQYN